MQQQVIAEQVKIEQVQKTGQIAVQEAEIQRRERELIATVLKQAEIERRKIEMLAEAQKQKLIFEADGQAASTPRDRRSRSRDHFQEGRGRSKGHEREGRSLPGLQPGGGHRQAHQQHARDRQGTRFPLANVDKITIVSTGNGDAAGMNKITGDVAAMAAQIPALFETLSGMQFSELLSKVKTNWRQSAQA